MASTARTPRVQLVLNLQHESPQLIHEQVLHVTDGHELVEARQRGLAPFEFHRKRKSCVAEAAVAAASPHTQRLSVHRTPAATRALTAVAAESPYADELELARPLGERIVEGLQGLPQRATQADRLLAFCASIGAAAVDAAAQPQRRTQSRLGPRGGCSGSARAAVLADALAAFQSSLAAALADGSVALAAPQRPPATPVDDGVVEQQAPGYQVDLQARKAGLRKRLENFQKEEEEWHSLLQKVEALDQQQLGAAPGGEDARAARGTGADAPPAAAEAPAGQAGLSSVATEPGVYGQQAAQAAAASDSSGSGEGGAEGDEALAALERAHAGVHRHLAMQVEGMCKLVDDVELLVERANRSAAAVQAEYHAEKFRAFAHVDSPARLIRELVRLPGASKAAAAGKEAAAAAAAAAEGKENAAAVDMEVS